ncbi:MAG: hypothetical protein ACMUIU_13475 [bacterium]
MKRKFFVMLEVTIILALIAVMLGSVTAEADPPDPNKVYKTNYIVSGKNASLNYNTEGECEEIFVFLQISEYMVKHMSDVSYPPPTGPMGFLDIEIWNWCDDKEKWGYAQIELTSFSISENLRSAFAEGKGTLEWEDQNNEEPITEEVTINIKWTGESAVSSSRVNFRSRFTAFNSDFRMHLHSSGISRYGSAKGLIKGETFEIEVDAPFYPPNPYTAFPYYYGLNATIDKSDTGSITIEKRLKQK